MPSGWCGTSRPRSVCSKTRDRSAATTKPANTVLRPALALREVDEAPHGGLLTKLLLRSAVEAAFGETGIVQREPLGHARDRNAGDQDRGADPAALAHGAG